MNFRTREPGLDCPRCGTALPAALDGLCAACLLRSTADQTDDLPDDMDIGTLALPLDDRHSIHGRRVGNYELQDEIARGGMGIVYRARQVSTGRIVALKIMLPQLVAMPRMRERFATEVRAAASLDHPGILPIHEVNEYAGLPFFTMKYADGGSLDRRVAALAGRWREVAALVSALARAIEHAHVHGVVHRDLKPANVLFDVSDRPLIGDFGLAHLHADTGGTTLPATALGTPHYMAPEQVSAEFGAQGPGTDVYGLGAILYELLTGVPPTNADNALAALHAIVHERLVPAARRRADVPLALDAIATRALEKLPADRYASAAALADDLDAWAAGRDAQADLDRRRSRRRRVVLAALAVTATGVAILSTLLSAHEHGGARSGTPAAAAGVAPGPRDAIDLARSIGVVAFRNTSHAVADDALTLIVTDDLLRELRQVEMLRVVPFRIGPDETRAATPSEIAAGLGVDLLLTGELERSPAGLRVTARLWDAHAGAEVWVRTFESPDGDALDLRAQIGFALVSALQVRTGDDRSTAVAPTPPTASRAAYRSYLRGRYLLRWRRPETLVEASRELHAAIAADPSFAQAHSALAATYALWIPDLPCPDGDPTQLALEHAASALQLDPRLGEPRAIVAHDHTMRGRPREAEAEFVRALAAEPRDPSTLHLYAIHLFAVGRVRAALEVERRAVALDPTSAQPIMWLAMLTTLRGDAAEARRLWSRAEEIGAARPLGAAIVRLELGEDAPLRRWFANPAERSGLPNTPLPAERSLVEGVLDPARAPEAIAWLRGAERQVAPAFAITFYSMLGAVDDAYRVAGSFDLADDTTYALRLVALWTPRLAPLRRDARFAALATRWQLADYWQAYGPPDECALEDGHARCR